MNNIFDTKNCIAEIEKSMKVLKRQKEVVEIRILNTSRGTISGYYDDHIKLARDISKYIGVNNIYFTINPVKQGLLSRSMNRLKEYAKATTADGDIENRSILMIDLDAKRPAEISSTEEEHEKAVKKAEEVKAFLAEQGWPEPIMADSGNGAHLLYRIELPNDKECTELVKAVLQALDGMFTDSDVEVDKTTYNASRICKVYGTVACKGDSTEDRPHRLSKIISLPDSFETVTEGKLKSLASMIPYEVDKSVERKDSSLEIPKLDLKKWMDMDLR